VRVSAFPASLTHPPSTPPSAEQLGRAPEDIVKLDANENPYGPPPGASPSSPTPIDGAFRVDPNVSAIAIDVATARGGRERARHRESASPRPKRLPTLNQRPHTADARRLFLSTRKTFFFVSQLTFRSSLSSSEVNEALGNLKFPHIYPDPESRALRAALAEECGVSSDCLLVGCGADELIDLLMRVILDPGDVIINTPPTFGMYAFDCAVNAGVVVDVPRFGPEEGFRMDVAGIKEAVAKHKPKLLFLTSPNNPDGSVLPDEDLEELLKLPVLIVLDEAYIEFSGIANSRIKEVETRDNLIVLRTFSKRAALAGMRVGYGAFPKGIVEFMWRAKQPYNVSVAAEVAALAALSNPQYLKDVKEKLVSERDNLFNVLKECPFLSPYPSAANFILCRVDGRDALEVKDALAKEGICVRHYTKPASISGCVRVSVGRPDQTALLKEALTKI
jgi:histidinol-phosphate aminotransferase